MSHYTFRQSAPLNHFQAFRRVTITDDLGYRSEITVPSRLSNEQVRNSCRVLERYVTMHAGSLAEVVYQAYLGCVDWFRFHRQKQQDAHTADYFRRMKTVLQQATTYHQRLADKDFIEAYNGCVVGDQSQSIEHLRSACYDVFKQDHDPAKALDMAFVAQIYASACYQVQVCTAVIKTEFQHSGINWVKPFRRFFLDDIASYADRLLRAKYGLDIVEKSDQIAKIAEYVFMDITRSLFDPERIERNIRAAYAEMPPDKQKLYGSVEDQLAYYPIPNLKGRADE